LLLLNMNKTPGIKIKEGKIKKPSLLF